MSIEDDYLTQLRAAYRALQDQAGDFAAVEEAIRVLLRVAIADHEKRQAKADDTVFNSGAFSATPVEHHERGDPALPDEEVPTFMETGDPIALPPSTKP